MPYGPIKVFAATMASAGTLTSEVNLSQSWGTVYLSIPTMTSNTQFHVQAAASSGGTYRRVKSPAVVSVTTAVPSDFVIASAATNCIIPIPTGLQYVKIETTATVDNGTTFSLICSF